MSPPVGDSDLACAGRWRGRGARVPDNASRSAALPARHLVVTRNEGHTKRARSTAISILQHRSTAAPSYVAYVLSWFNSYLSCGRQPPHRWVVHSFIHSFSGGRKGKISARVFVAYSEGLIVIWPVTPWCQIARRFRRFCWTVRTYSIGPYVLYSLSVVSLLSVIFTYPSWFAQHGQAAPGHSREY